MWQWSGMILSSASSGWSYRFQEPHIPFLYDVAWMWALHRYDELSKCIPTPPQWRYLRLIEKPAFVRYYNQEDDNLLYNAIFAFPSRMLQLKSWTEDGTWIVVSLRISTALHHCWRANACHPKPSWEEGMGEEVQAPWNCDLPLSKGCESPH